MAWESWAEQGRAGGAGSMALEGAGITFLDDTRASAVFAVGGNDVQAGWLF
jgi:hypothetical protein